MTIPPLIQRDCRKIRILRQSLCIFFLPAFPSGGRGPSLHLLRRLVGGAGRGRRLRKLRLRGSGIRGRGGRICLRRVGARPVGMEIGAVRLGEPRCVGGSRYDLRALRGLRGLDGDGRRAARLGAVVHRSGDAADGEGRRKGEAHDRELHALVLQIQNKRERKQDGHGQKTEDEKKLADCTHAPLPLSYHTRNASIYQVDFCKMYFRPI